MTKKKKKKKKKEIYVKIKKKQRKLQPTFSFNDKEHKTLGEQTQKKTW